MKKTIFTLNLNPKNYKPITELTYPLLKHYADKIGADFYVIKKRKFPQWPPTYEKLQIYELGQRMKNEWNIFIDCDAIVHPDTPDFSNHIRRDQVAHNGADMASFRWRYDRYFLRDGRHIGSPSWMCWASDWTIELFEPLKDMTPDQAEKNIFPITKEIKKGIEPLRLIEDYTMSRNIAKYGLKFIALRKILDDLGVGDSDLLFHLYGISIEEKIIQMKNLLKHWSLL